MPRIEEGEERPAIDRTVEEGDRAMTTLAGRDADHLRRAIAVALRARERGDRPFGAVLVGGDGRVLAEGANTEQTERDLTGHAETNLLREAGRVHDPETLAGATLYASGEPCAMCAGAIFWSGVGRVVYGASAERIRTLTASAAGSPVLRLACREVLAAGTRPTEVIGPALEAEAELVFARSAG
jgi:tRNA(Arg) A34 adenosine deaminase TadA